MYASRPPKKLSRSVSSRATRKCCYEIRGKERYIEGPFNCTELFFQEDKQKTHKLELQKKIVLILLFYFFVEGSFCGCKKTRSKCRCTTRNGKLWFCLNLQRIWLFTFYFPLFLVYSEPVDLLRSINVSIFIIGFGPRFCFCLNSNFWSKINNFELLFYFKTLFI